MSRQVEITEVAAGYCDRCGRWSPFVSLAYFLPTDCAATTIHYPAMACDDCRKWSVPR